MARYSRPATTRTYDAIHAEISEAADTLAHNDADAAGFWQTQAEGCERLVSLWNEIFWQAVDDKELPGWTQLAAMTARDHYANEACRARTETGKGTSMTEPTAATAVHRRQDVAPADAIDREPKPTFDADTCERIFHAALAAGDFKGVEAALTVMAPQDPHRAELLFNTLKVGLAMAEHRPRCRGCGRSSGGLTENGCPSCD
ncbi:hypothetical protein AB0C42_24335 [Micromonospora taraxaci]|uniref:hypothetical protein n=1 Tax=Micromonospora taraxaci TaxID=1316803 RepID=UPI0033F6D71B